ncbi:MAG TPA: hypothetical protein VHB79_23900 [Polyangiaceae bacterium]|nr:hypothetical protein [Polyangiaceae bacterium]
MAEHLICCWRVDRANNRAQWAWIDPCSTLLVAFLGALNKESVNESQ